MDFFSSPDLWVAFLTLFALELVLGIDNIVFISILTNRLPESQQQRARILGLTLALVMRILLLFVASWIVGLTEPWFSIGDAEVLHFSGRDLILIVGGLFLIYKAVTEIHAKLEGEDEHGRRWRCQATFGAVIVQIILIDAVFSLDSVITAVGMVDELSIMIAAVMLSIGLMMVLADPDQRLRQRPPDGEDAGAGLPGADRCDPGRGRLRRPRRQAADLRPDRVRHRRRGAEPDPRQATAGRADVAGAGAPARETRGRRHGRSVTEA